MTITALTQSEVWRDQFRQLQSIIQSDASLSLKLKECADNLRRVESSGLDVYLRRQLEKGIDALESAAHGDYGGINQQFHDIVNTSLEDAGREHVLCLIVKDIDAGKPPHLLIIHCVLDRRTLAAQSVLRSAEFLDALAQRLGVTAYSPAARTSRVQGVKILNHAGYVRYAVFADLLYEMDWTTSHVDGGLLFSVTADEFVRHDLALMEALFPAESGRLRLMGVLDIGKVQFLFNIFLVLHDALGHTLPYPVHHWTKRLVGSFMLDPFEELGADAQFFWMASSAKMRPFLARVLDEAEAEALPLLWLMKRICHYTRRGISADAIHGNLMEDGDGRTGVLFWQYFLQHGVFARDGSHFRLNRELFPATVEKLLDDWLAVEAELPGGVESYASALSGFYLKYRSSNSLTGKWEIPIDLRRPPAVG